MLLINWQDFSSELVCHDVCDFSISCLPKLEKKTNSWEHHQMC